MEKLMQIKRVVSTSTIERLKQKARKLKRERSISHTEALDLVALSAGFNHWHQVTTEYEPYRIAEDAFLNGCVLAFEIKEAMDVNFAEGNLIEDPYLDFVADKKLLEIYGNFIDEDDELNRPLKATLSEAELEAEVRDNFSFMFFRLNPKACEFSLKSVLALIRKYSFWMPHYIWLQGTLIDSYSFPSEDDEGNVVAIRM
jgi:hypothetical protein